MNALTLKPAAALGTKRLSDILNRAYADYFVPVQLDSYQFRLMCEEQDVDLTRSVVAMAGAVPVGIALLSRRGVEGWLSGVGVHPLWRRRGIAREMVRWVQRAACEGGLLRLRLDVLEQNRGAIALYEALGFAYVRDLLVLALEPDGAAAKPQMPGIRPERPGRLLEAYARLHDIAPCWQRDVRSLKKRAEYMIGLALIDAQQLAGYMLYLPQVDGFVVMDLAVDPAHPQRTQIAEGLLLAVPQVQLSQGGHITNVPAQDPLLPAYMEAGYRVWYRQHEMAWSVANESGLQGGGGGPNETVSI
ncbi:MAG: GNAT family N-acetyltransferase [Anaerolineae bacterium]|nr:GNAT family N-acetyltransferase [Anaerolineae bacterium]